MNPPSALNSAMSRDRKPFTYTPGGLDLSEIKSQRMAQRLMRNAMNQGVPEVPVQSVHSSSNASAPVALPNYNCMPIQVFPTFNLPANPKSLLRTRSHPDSRDAPIQRMVQPQIVNNARVDDNDTFCKNTNIYQIPQINNTRPVSMYEYNTPPVNPFSIPTIDYGSQGYTAPLLPEISYEAEYFCAPPKVNSAFEQLPKLEISEDDKLLTNKSVGISTALTVNPLADVTIPIIGSTLTETKPAEDNLCTENEKREVKVVKKQIKEENKAEEQNGNQNGDTEAEMTVKLPTKKSGAKTETKVEVVKKVLPDGSVEEIKTTTTKTTIDGRTEIKTKTETTTIPKEEAESEEEVVEEEEEEAEATVQEIQEEKVEEDVEEPETTTIASPKENGQEIKVVRTEERSETTTTKKVVVVQESPKEEQSVQVEEEEEEEFDEEEIEENEPVTITLKKQVTPEPTPPSVVSKLAEEDVEEGEEEEEEVEENTDNVTPKAVAETPQNEEEDEEDQRDEEEEEVEMKTKEVKVEVQTKSEEDEEEEVEEEYEEAEEKEQTEVKVEHETESKETEVDHENEKEAILEEKVEQEKETVSEQISEKPQETPKEAEEKIIQVEIAPEEPKSEPKEEKTEPTPKTEYKIPIREPSIPLEKVEDVEIKPIGSTPIISKTHSENTEIITSTIDPKSGLSTQTEYNKIENIVTVNRTTKILDHNYENLTQQGIPTVRTYFPPPSIDRISTSPMPSRPYQPVYPPEPTTERRHSLLLERLSMERQMPSDVYQYSNQTNQSYDQTQYPDEPRSEVLTVSNVKPSSITDQQWYQQKNVIYNNVSSTPASQSWAQPKNQSQPEQQYQPQPQPHYQPQHQQYQSQSQPQTRYQPSPTPQPQYQASPTPQPQYQPPSTPLTQYQPSTLQPQYQPFTEPIPERAPSSYSAYTPKPTWVSNIAEPQKNISQPNQYSYLSKDTSDSYQRSSQQYSSSYVPPPWEQDSRYTSVNNTSQVYYQPAQQPETQSFSPAPAQGWKPPQPAKFSKNAPIAYIPPAPNQSFVRSASVSEPPRTPGRKTYYSEYERRYITVPESTYIPTETKYQPQPDPSPQYYYDNNEPTEQVEPQWRRELREFTEKSSQTTTTTTDQVSVQPPWEAEQKYVKTPSSTYTPTPTWSQTLRPRSWRERSFESEYMSQEWPKTNTLGRGRPLSTLGKSMESAIPERTRGVSVDRYNPKSYQSPAEHPPVQSHTLTTPTLHSGYHNPNVPAYHARASAEPREQPTSYQPRVYKEARASPLQSRSFKYLQWITGTEN